MTDKQEAYRTAYELTCSSFAGITEFRGKLLTLLPLATGAGGVLLLRQTSSDEDSSTFLGPVGLFGVVVTVGLSMYEFRGIQRCHRLERQAANLESKLGLSTEFGQFRSQPRRRLGDTLGPPSAGLVVYLAAIFAWVYVAGVGLHWWDDDNSRDSWILIPVYAISLLILWLVIWKFMPRWAEPGPDLAMGEEYDDFQQRLRRTEDRVERLEQQPISLSERFRDASRDARDDA